jgi:hypothetical protein
MHAMTSCAPVFVAGTGRSGTSLLADVIGEHPRFHRIPVETRLIVDPGGLRDLADALTARYDPYTGDDAIRRLSDMLTADLPGRYDSWRRMTVPQAIGEQNYRDAVRRLWQDLVAVTFDEPAPDAEAGPAGRVPGPFGTPPRRRVIPRYFGDRGELIAILRRAVSTMFGGAAAAAGKPAWCEKTPFNLLCMDFLWELFPEAAIVHVKRHPVAVVASHVDQPWAPSTVEGALAWLRPVYDRWLAWKAAACLSGRTYLEVRAEDLAADWPARRRELFGLLGAGDFATESEFRPGVLRARDGQFDRRTREYVERELGGIIAAMGYA